MLTCTAADQLQYVTIFQLFKLHRQSLENTNKCWKIPDPGKYCVLE